MFKFKTFPILVLIFFFIVSPTLYSQIIKDDFRVNDDTTGGVNYTPDVEILESGEAIIVWLDERSGPDNIYGQVYDASGDSVGANFKVSTYGAGTYEYNPAISSYGDSLLVIWQYGSGQWLLSDGSRSGSSFNLRSASVFNPDVVVSDSGIFVVWHYYVSGSGNEVFLMRFDFDGDSIGPRIIVNDDGTSEDQYFPRIAMDNEGNFVVVWQDHRNVSYDIYGQLFKSSGDTAGGNFLINDDIGSSAQYNPYCAMDKSGNFTVVWEDYRDGYSYVYGQRFDNTGDSLGDNFRIEQDPGSENQYVPRVSMNENNFVVTWQDDRNSTSIYKRRFLNDGTPVSIEVKVNDLDGTQNQYEPAIDMDANGNVVITWYDYREPSGIYFQRLDALGNTLGWNLRIDNGYYPDVAISDDSSFAITYSYSNNIYYQRFKSSGDSIGSPAIISDTTHGSRYYPVIDIDSGNNAVIAWYDYRRGDYDIYAQMVDGAGDTIGRNFRVNDDAGTANQQVPAIAMNPSGKFLIAWDDNRNNDYDIYGQLYDSDGNTVGTNFRIDSGGTYTQSNADIGYHPDGNFIVVWRDSRVPSGIYAQVIDSMGTPVDTNFMVSDQFGYYTSPSISVSPLGGFVVTWQDSRDGNYNIYAQRYNPDYSPASINYKVNNGLEGLNPDQGSPDVVTDGTNIIFTWQDPKWQMGYDIAAKVVDWSFTSIDEKEPIEISEMLLPNIPNPFINSTLIRYQTKIKQKISMKIFDLSGRLITTLLDGLVESGIHSKRWNGEDARGREVPAGIYFCRLDAGDKSESRKLVLLR